MKILTVLTYYRPHTSGLTIYAERLVKALVRRGHQVTVLASRFEGAPAEETIDGVRIVRSGGKYWFNFHVRSASKALIRDHGFDLVDGGERPNTVVRDDDVETNPAGLLLGQHALEDPVQAVGLGGGTVVRHDGEVHVGEADLGLADRIHCARIVRVDADEIGRASCRERMCLLV